MSSEQDPLVSVVIGTKNSASTLGVCLEAVRAQTYAGIEVLVVDNYSDDDTVEIARKYTEYVYEKGPERTAQWNHAIEQARGDCIQILAADAEMTPDVIAECVALYQVGHGMVIIPEKHVGTGFWTRARALERECYLGDDTIEAPWFYSKEGLREVGGFNQEMFAGEDWDLFNRLKTAGYTYERCRSFIHHHLGHLRFGDAIRKKYYYGSQLRSFIRDHRSSSMAKVPLFRLAYIRNWKKLLRHPILSLGFLTLKFFETVAVALSLALPKRFQAATPYRKTG